MSRLLVRLTGVLADDRATGVFHAFCAGLGVMLTNSAKSKPCPGVLGNRLPPPGVVICDDGSVMSRPTLEGGVDGGSILVLVEGTAGDGEAARYKRRSAPSSPDFAGPEPAGLSLMRRLGIGRLRIGGVVGGDERKLVLNDCVGKRSSSSSELAAKLGETSSSAILRAPWKKETSGPVDVVKCCCRLGLIGDDCASWWLSFHDR